MKKSLNYGLKKFYNAGPQDDDLSERFGFLPSVWPIPTNQGSPDGQAGAPEADQGLRDQEQAPGADLIKLFTVVIYEFL